MHSSDKEETHLTFSSTPKFISIFSLALEEWLTAVIIFSCHLKMCFYFPLNFDVEITASVQLGTLARNTIWQNAELKINLKIADEVIFIKSKFGEDEKCNDGFCVSQITSFVLSPRWSLFSCFKCDELLSLRYTQFLKNNFNGSFLCLKGHKTISLSS